MVQTSGCGLQEKWKKNCTFPSFSIHVQNKNRTIQGCTGTSAPPYWTRTWHTREIMAKHSGGLKGGEHRMLSQSETSALQRSAITKKRALASKTADGRVGQKTKHACLLARSWSQHKSWRPKIGMASDLAEKSSRCNLAANSGPTPMPEKQWSTMQQYQFLNMTSLK